MIWDKKLFKCIKILRIRCTKYEIHQGKQTMPVLLYNVNKELIQEHNKYT